MNAKKYGVRTVWCNKADLKEWFRNEFVSLHEGQLVRCYAAFALAEITGSLCQELSSARMAMREVKVRALQSIAM